MPNVGHQKLRSVTMFSLPSFFTPEIAKQPSRLGDCSSKQTAMVSTRVMMGAAPPKAFSSAGATIAGVAVGVDDRSVLLFGYLLFILIMAIILAAVMAPPLPHPSSREF
jgi:hypothetical protein